MVRAIRLERARLEKHLETVTDWNYQIVQAVVRAMVRDGMQTPSDTAIAKHANANPQIDLRSLSSAKPMAKNAQGCAPCS